MKDGEAWHSAVHGVAKSRTHVSNGTTMTKNSQIHRVRSHPLRQKKKKNSQSENTLVDARG